MPYAIAVNSATSALHIAYMALGLGPGDELWTAPITFVATANAALYCGAGVRFVDIDPTTYVIDLDRLEAMLVTAETEVGYRRSWCQSICVGNPATCCA